MTVIISIVLLIAIVFFTYCKIVDWKIDREIKQERAKRSSVEKRLTESLKGICGKFGIKLSYHAELGTAAGRILYYKKGGRLLVDGAEIEILERFRNEPYVLAHELGHYIAIKQRQDESERGADNEADKLCRLILNEEEQQVLSLRLQCYFHI